MSTNIFITGLQQLQKRLQEAADANRRAHMEKEAREVQLQVFASTPTSPINEPVRPIRSLIGTKRVAAQRVSRIGNRGGIGPGPDPGALTFYEATTSSTNLQDYFRYVEVGLPDEPTIRFDFPSPPKPRLDDVIRAERREAEIFSEVITIPRGPGDVIGSQYQWYRDVITYIYDIKDSGIKWLLKADGDDTAYVAYAHRFCAEEYYFMQRYWTTEEVVNAPYPPWWPEHCPSAPDPSDWFTPVWEIEETWEVVTPVERTRTPVTSTFVCFRVTRNGVAQVTMPSDMRATLEAALPTYTFSAEAMGQTGSSSTSGRGIYAYSVMAGMDAKRAQVTPGFIIGCTAYTFLESEWGSSWTGFSYPETPPSEEAGEIYDPDNGFTYLGDNIWRLD